MANYKRQLKTPDDGRVLDFTYIRTNDLDQEAVGDRIKAIRLANNLTLEKMAESLNISLSGLRKLETGLAFPSGKNIFLLHEIYGVDISWLLYGVHSNHMSILEALQAETDESKFDIFTRLYSYFSTHDTMCLVESYGKAPGTEHFANWDGVYFKEIKPVESSDYEDKKETTYEVGKMYDSPVTDVLQLKQRIESLSDSEKYNLLQILFEKKQ